MAGVLDGVRVVEVSMWAMVPAAGAVLAEWGADVVKIEGPQGDPIRGLVTAGINPTGPKFTWEMWNRGKRAIALDLTTPEGREIVRELAVNADVFLTSILPHQRKKLGIDADTIRAANPGIVYASGTGHGVQGPDADKGGYDSVTFWARSGAADSVTPPGCDVVGMPAGAFGDSTAGLSLAGGIAAALVKKARTGEGSIVEGALFATGVWAMQMWITGSEAAGLERMPDNSRAHPFNALVNSYRTADDRWVVLCMMQFDVYWAGFCKAIGREDLIDDQRFVDPTQREANIEVCVRELDRTFATQPLAVWKERLATQEGQWDVVKRVSELLDDPQVQANKFAQRVDYPGGHSLSLVASPVQFDHTPPTLRPAPEFAGNTDEVLEDLGWDTEKILDAKIKGAVI
jgi:crotonobetainyl-CoA:carnitine CoA-transferase CaiB-like acyl-CoA transferase